MRKNLPVTQVERQYHAEERLISETDTRGILTTANASFCEVSGFRHEELVGKSHNLVRHPDVPPAIFADLWRTIKAGERWVGVVKNRCKNGDHYWVKAVVAPVTEDGQITRYRSVRKQPTRVEIEAAEALYKRVWAGEQGAMDTLAEQRRQQRATMVAINNHGAQLSQIGQSNAAATQELSAASSELARIAAATFHQADQFRTN